MPLIASGGWNMNVDGVRARLNSPFFWLIVLLAVALALGIGATVNLNTDQVTGILLTATPAQQPGAGELPSFTGSTERSGLSRPALPATQRLSSSRYEPIEYIVEFGDSLFGIAERYGLEPESLLWANEETLNGRPDTLEPGMALYIPPTDGVLYLWQEGDTLESVARSYSALTQSILDWPGNEIADLAAPMLQPGSLVMIPGGKGEFQQWVFPDLGGGGVSANLLGPGACTGEYGSGNGSGSFVWPSPIHSIVGNDYWDAHRALDIATGEGIGIYAADGGVVLFAGWANGGYGYMVYLDHGNGYSTLYAHLSQVVATCGSQVSKGAIIGYGGSTGNSTGPHLHFEVRFQGGFLNPWQILPAP